MYSLFRELKTERWSLANLATTNICSFCIVEMLKTWSEEYWPYFLWENHALRKQSLVWESRLLTYGIPCACGSWNVLFSFLLRWAKYYQMPQSQSFAFASIIYLLPCALKFLIEFYPLFLVFLKKPKDSRLFSEKKKVLNIYICNLVLIARHI